MPYRFSFDLTCISRAFFREIARVAREKNLHGRIGAKAQSLAKKFRILEITGLDASEAIMLIEDLVDVYTRNLLDRERFRDARKKALFLPHCSRKYMDNRCQAHFDTKISSYQCSHCSQDCLINHATTLGKKRGYDVYVVPGGSCIPKILANKGYEGIVGVACSDELKLAMRYLDAMKLCGQAVPLTKNGCANTRFSIKSLERIL
jgi:hypothetical protein